MERFDQLAKDAENRMNNSLKEHPEIKKIIESYKKQYPNEQRLGVLLLKMKEEDRNPVMQVLGSSINGIVMEFLKEMGEIYKR
ncbi:MAG: hypothetical protein ACXAC2_20355 [Candidatus Kariarchaeaceae archaeon]|jgi:hypothetical protein